MDDIRKIDLHLHTNISDGTDSPEELLMKVKDAGIVLFSVTDHDAVTACRLIRRILPSDGPAFLTGVEFSCRDEEGQYHILGYGSDPDAAPLSKVLEKGHGYRVRKTQARLHRLADDFGFRFSDEDVRALFALDNPGKPHLGELMARYGYAPDKDAAIAEVLNRIDLPDMYVRPVEAIGGILASGGIPVLAHPVLGSGDELILGEDLERRIRTLTEFGLKGVEAFYSKFTEDQRAEVLDLADRLGLYVTAGSDYHGTRKDVKLGNTGHAGAAEIPDGLRRFLKDVSDLILP